LAKRRPLRRKTSDSVVTSASPTTSLSEDQIRQLIRESAAKDQENDSKLRDYTYFERQRMRRIDGRGQAKSTEVKTYDVMEIYGERVQKLISKGDKPLSARDAKKEDEKIQKLIDKRNNESESDRKRRLQKEEKEREDNRQFVGEVANAYNFRFVGMESLDGRENYVIGKRPNSCPSSAFVLGSMRSSGGSSTCSASIRFRLDCFCCACTKVRAQLLNKRGSMMKSGCNGTSRRMSTFAWLS
jgi:hypothetical protein